MPEYKIDQSGQGGPDPGSGNSNEQTQSPMNRLAYRVALLLEGSDSAIYAVVGVFFVLAGIVALGFSIWDFINSFFVIPSSNQAVFVTSSIIRFISDLLLVLIIMEVLGTVIEYLKVKVNSVTPFLFIGIISATRGILSIGARLSVQNIALPNPEFTSAMVELSVNAMAILALGITLRLLRNSR